jgi:hypothetical protein
MAVVALGLLAGPPGASPAPRKNIPVPLGFWVGKGKFADVSAKIGEVDVHISKGTYWIDLISDPQHESLDVTGDLYLDLFGSGELNVGGIDVSANLNFHGVFELGDLPDAVYADGAYRMTGVAIVNGFDVPIDQVIATTGPVTVTSATCKTIKGELPSGIGAYHWTAKLKFDLGVKCT